MATPYVLIVDDSFIDRLVASKVLKSCNIQDAMITMIILFAFSNHAFMMYCSLGFSFGSLITLVGNGLLFVCLMFS
jgi:hypothetical protein